MQSANDGDEYAENSRSLSSCHQMHNIHAKKAHPIQNETKAFSWRTPYDSWNIKNESLQNRKHKRAIIHEQNATISARLLSSPFCFVRSCVLDVDFKMGVHCTKL